MDCGVTYDRTNTVYNGAYTQVQWRICLINSAVLHVSHGRFAIDQLCSAVNAGKTLTRSL